MRVNVYSRVLFLLIGVSVVLLILSQPIFAQSGYEPPAASPTAAPHDSVALINPEWLAIQGDLVWEATMMVGSNGGFLGEWRSSRWLYHRQRIYMARHGLYSKRHLLHPSGVGPGVNNCQHLF